MNQAIRKYLQEIGRRGGRRSRRVLTSADAKKMVLVREAARAYREFHTRCFWSYDPNYRIRAKDVPWVAEQLRVHGNRIAWELADRLHPLS